MFEIARRVYVNAIIIDNEYDFMHGSKRMHAVRFVYRGKNGNDEELIMSNYTEALRLALRRATDKRYSNNTFEIFG